MRVWSGRRDRPAGGRAAADRSGAGWARAADSGPRRVTVELDPHLPELVLGEVEKRFARLEGDAAAPKARAGKGDPQVVDPAAGRALDPRPQPQGRPHGRVVGQGAEEAHARGAGQPEEGREEQGARADREEREHLGPPGVEAEEGQEHRGPEQVAPARGQALLVEGPDEVQDRSAEEDSSLGAGPRHPQTPTGTRSSTSRTRSSLSTPAYLALVSRARRWARVGTATAFTSSGIA